MKKRKRSDAALTAEEAAEAAAAAAAVAAAVDVAAGALVAGEVADANESISRGNWAIIDRAGLGERRGEKFFCNKCSFSGNNDNSTRTGAGNATSHFVNCCPEKCPAELLQKAVAAFKAQMKTFLDKVRSNAVAAGMRQVDAGQRLLEVTMQTAAAASSSSQQGDAFKCKGFNEKIFFMSNLLAKACAASGVGMSMAESDFVACIVHAFDPTFPIPSPDTVGTRVAKVFVDAVKPELHALRLVLERAEGWEGLTDFNVTVTADMWTADRSANKDGYMPTIGRWLSHDLQPVEKVLGISHFPGIHNCSSIYSVVHSVLRNPFGSKYDVSTDKVSIPERCEGLAVTDGGANIKKAMETRQKELQGRLQGLGHLSAEAQVDARESVNFWHWCVCHNAQLAVKDALNDDLGKHPEFANVRDVHEAMQDMDTVLSALCYRRRLEGLYKYACPAAGVTKKKIVTTNATRWSNECDRLASGIHLMPAIAEFAKKDNDLAANAFKTYFTWPREAQGQEWLKAVRRTAAHVATYERVVDLPATDGKVHKVKVTVSLLRDVLEVLTAVKAFIKHFEGQAATRAEVPAELDKLLVQIDPRSQKVMRMHDGAQRLAAELTRCIKARFYKLPGKRVVDGTTHLAQLLDPTTALDICLWADEKMVRERTQANPMLAQVQKSTAKFRDEAALHTFKTLWCHFTARIREQEQSAAAGYDLAAGDGGDDDDDNLDDMDVTDMTDEQLAAMAARDARRKARVAGAEAARTAARTAVPEPAASMEAFYQDTLKVELKKAAATNTSARQFWNNVVSVWAAARGNVDQKVHCIAHAGNDTDPQQAWAGCGPQQAALARCVWHVAHARLRPGRVGSP